jgi:hypothetical protein
VIVLGATTQSLEIVLAGAVTSAECRATACFREIAAAPAEYTPTTTTVPTAGAAAVTLVAAPVAGKQRVVDLVTVTNTDTAAVTLTVQVDVSGTKSILWKGALLVGEAISYLEGAGWQKLDADGVPSSVIAGTVDVVATGELIEQLSAMRIMLQSLTRTVGMAMPDASGRLLVNVATGSVTVAGSLTTVSTVTTVTTVATLTNQTNMGGYSAAPQIPALMNINANGLRSLILVT